MSRKPLGRELPDNHTSTSDFKAIAFSQLETFQATVKEFQQRIQNVLGLCQPYSLVHKELKDVLAMAQSKEDIVKSMQEELAAATEKHVFSDSQPRSNKTSISLLDDSPTEENPVQNFRKQGKELLSECKLVLDEMKNKNQALKSLYQPLGSTLATQKPVADILKFQPTSPLASQFSTPTPSVSKPILTTVGTLPTFNQEQEKLLLTPSAKVPNTSSGEVLANIEKFIQSFDQRNEGQSKRVDNIAREIETLKGRIQTKETLVEKLEQRKSSIEDKSANSNINKFLSLSPKDFWNKELQITKATPKTTASTREMTSDKFDEPEIPKKTERINEIHTTLDECSKFLARKRWEHHNAKEKEKSRENNISFASSPARRMQEKRSRNSSMGDNRSPLSKSDFDINATLSRRESRLKSFYEREERMKKEEEPPQHNQSLPTQVIEEFSMSQTLKRSNIDRKPIYEYYSSGKDKIVYCYEDELPGQQVEKLSQLTTPSKVEEEMTSTRKSCLVKKGRTLNSKENSGIKAEKKLRFADEQETPGRALKIEEISVSPLNPLEQKDLNSSLPPKSNVKKAVLRGEISQLDREIKRISQLLNSVVLSETI